MCRREVTSDKEDALRRNAFISIPFVSTSHLQEPVARDMLTGSPQAEEIGGGSVCSHHDSVSTTRLGNECLGASYRILTV